MTITTPLFQTDQGTRAQNQATLVIFCKRPKLNQGKQRLAAGSNAHIALEIAQGLLACAIEDANHWPGAVVIACASDTDIPWVQTLTQSAQVMTQLPQHTQGNLGDRLNYVDRQLRAQGHQQLVFIGTDAPILDQDFFEQTIRALQSNDVALHHADDGGVIIMANKTPWPSISHLPWSTNELSEALSEACRQHHLSVTYCKSGYDIDYVGDLKKLSIDLQNDERPARKALVKMINALFSPAQLDCQA